MGARSRPFQESAGRIKVYNCFFVIHPSIGLRLHKSPYTMPEQMFFWFLFFSPRFSFPPHSISIPRLDSHLLSPAMCRSIEPTSVKHCTPDGRPKSLPPRYIRPITEDVFVEQELSARFEQAVDKRPERALRRWHGAERENRDERIDRVLLATQTRQDGGGFLRAAAEDDERTGCLVESGSVCHGADFGMHERIGLQCYVLGHPGLVQVIDGVSVAF